MKETFKAHITAVYSAFLLLLAFSFSDNIVPEIKVKSVSNKGCILVLKNLQLEYWSQSLCLSMFTMYQLLCCPNWIVWGSFD